MLLEWHVDLELLPLPLLLYLGLLLNEYGVVAAGSELAGGLVVKLLQLCHPVRRYSNLPGLVWTLLISSMPICQDLSVVLLCPVWDGGEEDAPEELPVSKLTLFDLFDWQIVM